MRYGAFCRVALELREEALLPLRGLSQGGTRDQLLASLLRALFTRVGGELEACAGAVLLDEEDRARALTAPFGEEWPQADAQALELFTTARKTGLRRLVLFRLDPNPHSVPEVALRFAQEMRALGLLFAVEVVDLLVVWPRRHWSLSNVPLLGASLDCKATLRRSLDDLSAYALERRLYPVKFEDPSMGGLRSLARLLLEGYVSRGWRANETEQPD